MNPLSPDSNLSMNQVSRPGGGGGMMKKSPSDSAEAQQQNSIMVLTY
jgi:hypothetical protein